MKFGNYHLFRSALGLVATLHALCRKIWGTGMQSLGKRQQAGSLGHVEIRDPVLIATAEIRTRQQGWPAPRWKQPDRVPKFQSHFTLLFPNTQRPAQHAPTLPTLISNDVRDGFASGTGHCREPELGTRRHIGIRRGKGISWNQS